MPFIDPDEDKAVNTNELNFGGIALPLIANAIKNKKVLIVFDFQSTNWSLGRRGLKQGLDCTNLLLRWGGLLYYGLWRPEAACIIYVYNLYS